MLTQQNTCTTLMQQNCSSISSYDWGLHVQPHEDMQTNRLSSNSNHWGRCRAGKNSDLGKLEEKGHSSQVNTAISEHQWTALHIVHPPRITEETLLQLTCSSFCFRSCCNNSISASARARSRVARAASTQNSSASSNSWNWRFTLSLVYKNISQACRCLTKLYELQSNRRHHCLSVLEFKKMTKTTVCINYFSFNLTAFLQSEFQHVFVWSQKKSIFKGLNLWTKFCFFFCFLVLHNNILLIDQLSIATEDKTYLSPTF